MHYKMSFVTFLALTGLACASISYAESISEASVVEIVKDAKASGEWLNSPVDPALADLMESVIIHRPLNEVFFCSEHYNDLQGLGNTLGRDCHIEGFLMTDDGGRRRGAFKTDGKRNQDYFGYNAPLLAPFDGIVVMARSVPESNKPGFLQHGRSGNVAVRREDGTIVVYAHVKDITVELGEHVNAGEPVGRVGANGTTWMPHVHIGAWRGKMPLQPRFRLQTGSTDD